MLNKYIKDLCGIFGPSGNEDSVLEYIKGHLPDYAAYNIDPLGNLIVNVKGKAQGKHKVMLDAHMDEVGFIITGITEDGFLRFSAVGGIEVSAMLAKSVVIDEKYLGVICSKPIHMQASDEREKLPSIDELYIDIGASDIKSANKYVKVGSTAVFKSEFKQLGDGKFLSKAIDDRAGCAVLLDIINTYRDYDYTVSFSTQEEVGLRGAGCAAYGIDPEYAIVVESTTAADIPEMSGSKRVCELSGGAAISYMDSATLYSRKLFDKCFEIAKENGIKVQPKMLPSGGNNAGRIHLTKSGINTVSLSLPCRYIHSSSSVADFKDLESLKDMSLSLLKHILDGRIDD